MMSKFFASLRNTQVAYNWVKRGSYILLVIIVLITTFLALYLFKYTQALLDERLNGRLMTIASNAALQFSEEEINDLLGMTPEERVKTDLYKNIVLKLQRIKKINPDVTFVYIYGKTKDSNIVEFVADADVIALRPELNFNEDEQTIEGYTGYEYDASEVPLISEDVVFANSVVDEEFYDTTWGRLMTSYAPIKDKIETERSQSVLGVDVDISDHARIINATFLPFGIFIIVLVASLIVMTVSMVRMWGSRIDFFKDLDRQKDELLSIVSHQLATPVSSLKWYTEMLIDGDLGKISKEQKEHVQTMHSISGNLSDLVSMILDVSRIQLGRIRIEKQELNLNEFFKEILSVIEPKAMDKKVKFQKIIPSKLPEAMLDKRYTNMTIENLLSNAIKYTPENGEVIFEVKIIKNQMHCTVKDTGMGIPKSEHDKIFGRMFRASNVRNAVDGNGFGLYVAKGAVEAQGGQISFESEEGKGTTFSVVLPLSDK